VAWTLLASSLLALGTAAGFALVGRLALTRRRHSRQPTPLAFFALFWFSAAIVWATQGLSNLAGWMGVASLPLNGALDEASSPFYCLAAASLLYYVLCLLTGRERLLAPLLVYYLGLYVALRWTVLRAGRLDVVVDAWQVRFAYATPLQDTTYTLVVALIALPLLGAILAYGALWLRIRDAAQRYRIALTALGLLAWVGTEAFSFTSGLANTTGGELARRLVALGSTLLVLAAYLPPAWARARWGARSAFEPAG